MNTPLCIDCLAVLNLVNGEELSYWCSADTDWTRVPAFESLCHYKFSSIELQALAGCFICTKLQAWLTKHGVYKEYAGLDVNVQPNASEAGVWKFRFGMSQDDGNRLPNDYAGGRFTFTCHPLGSTTIRANSSTLDFYMKFVTSKDLLTNSGNSHSLGLVKHWIQECLQSHETCSIEADPAVYPPRLLCLNDSKICLIRDTSTIKGTPYAALSHSWGPNPQQLILTTENQSALCEVIEEESLPPTFLDAIKVTRSLGIDYLWIDSLCIIQAGSDHRTDWLGHSAIMGTIYQNCYINIAAAHGRDASAGCFVNRDPIEIAPCIIDIRRVTKIADTEVSEFTLERDSALTPHLLVPEPLLYDNVGHFHLDTRAWVCQERLLSPRTVYFSLNQLFWECCGTENVCETVPEGTSGQILPTQDEFPYMGDAIGVGFSWGTMKFDENIPPYSWKSPSPQNQYEWWLKTLHGYVSRNLTKSSDKLPAIGGIAERTARILRDEYLAGIFKSKLPEALLWSCVQERRPVNLRSQDQFFAPSWSWASLKGELDFTPLAEEDERTLCSVISSHIDPVDPDNLFGQVSSASLTIKAPFISFERKLLDNPENWVYHFGQLKMNGLSGKKQLLYFDFDPCTLDCESLALIVIRENARPTTYPGSGDMEEAGLILAPVLTDNREQFVRIGVFKGIEYRKDDRSGGYEQYATITIV